MALQLPNLPSRMIEEFIHPLENVCHERVKLAIDYWSSLRGARAMPRHDEITLRGMARFISEIVLVEVLDGGFDYAYGFMGDCMVRAFNVSLTGMKLSEIEMALPEFGTQLRALYEEAIHGHAFIARGRLQNHKSAISHAHETAVLPLGGEGKVTHLLIVGVPRPLRYWQENDGGAKIRSLQKAC
jgi:hypothetical protein